MRKMKRGKLRCARMLDFDNDMNPPGPDVQSPYTARLKQIAATGSTHPGDGTVRPDQGSERREFLNLAYSPGRRRQRSAAKVTRKRRVSLNLKAELAETSQP